MKLVIIRHGDPNYEDDCLTEKGKIEAVHLARFVKERIRPTAVYSSPRGRAKETCIASQKECGFDFEVLDWMEEFNAYIFNPKEQIPTYIWDLHPSLFTEHPMLYDCDNWLSDPLFEGSDAAEKYKVVKDGLEALLKKHGYVRAGNSKLFHAVRANRDVVVLYCHFGVLSIMLSVLTGFSPYVFLQHFCALPTSVTTIATEEREEGIVSFRCIGFGDLSHLALGGEEASFAARFCETFDSEEQH